MIVEPASSTSINLTWGTPHEVSSPIVMYNVNCTSRTASITVLTPDNRTSFLVAGLRPYTNYSCCVMTITTLPLQGSSACNYTTTPPDSKPQFQHVNCIVGVSTIKHLLFSHQFPMLLLQDFKVKLSTRLLFSCHGIHLHLMS